MLNYNNILYDEINLYVPTRYFNNTLSDRFEKKTYEAQESFLIKKFFNKNDYVLDIGSCLGYITAILAKKCAYVIGIEANPELLNCLKLMQNNNNFQNIDIINCYISNTRETINFHTYDLIVAGSGDRKDDAKEWSKTRKDYIVECKKIESIPKIELVNAACIDCEGGEKIFLTENEVFLRKINKLMIELHGFIMNDKKFDKECFKIIESYGFVNKERYGNCYYFEK